MKTKPKTTVIRKFKFADLNLAFKVRANMLAALKKYDANRNLLFDEYQIRDALVGILGEDENQLDYVVKNVFRYDRDGDKSITYSELTNFSVEQHFGEMAIQRLHKKGYYTNGARKIMNLEEFQSTLNYCLNFIYSNGTHAEYERLFKEVDLDNDGFISYSDYFVFLREYFGSQSEAFIEEDDAKPAPIPEPEPVPVPTIDGELAKQKFAKLIYSQFKITVMERDKNKNLLLQKDEVSDILSNVLRLSYSEQMQLQDKLLGGAKSVRYEDFMRAVVTNYMSTSGAQKNFGGSSLGQNEFVDLINKLCHFVSIKPADIVLKSCFKLGTRGAKSMNQSQFSSLMRSIFENYKFDNRGLPATKPLGR